MKSIQSYIGGTPSCPVCRKSADCELHWIGWTEDGHEVEMRCGLPAEPLRSSDITIGTGVTVRVYRERQ